MPHLHNTINTIPDAIFVLNPAGKIVIANRAARGLFGVQDLLDKKISTFDASLQKIEQIIEDTPPQDRIEFEVHSEKLGQDFQISINKNQDEDDENYVVVLHDITAMKNLLQFKDQMLRIASHDIRGPLALIIGYADILLSDYPDPENLINQFSSAIYQSSVYIDNLLEEILNIDRVQSIPESLFKENNIIDLAETVLQSVQATAQQKSITIVKRFTPEQHIMINADPVLIRQSMMNLISNAIKYTPEDGEVLVEIDCQDGYCLFEVEDTGIGIAEQDLPYVFESFFRAKNKDFPTSKGAGLGLSLVRNAIERHRGEVWVKSKERVGSRFGFKLPIINQTQ